MTDTFQNGLIRSEEVATRETTMHKASVWDLVESDAEESATEPLELSNTTGSTVVGSHSDGEGITAPPSAQLLNQFATEGQKRDAAEVSLYASSWLKRTKWPEFFENHDLATLSEKLNPAKKGYENDGFYTLSQAIYTIYNESTNLVKQIDPVLSAQLRTLYDNETTLRPIYVPIHETIKKYSSIVARTIFILLQIHRQDLYKVFGLSPTNRLKAILTFFDESLRNRTEPTKKTVALIRRLIAHLSEYPIDGSEFQHPWFVSISILSIRLNNEDETKARFAEPSEFTSDLAAIVSFIRMTTIGRCIEAFLKEYGITSISQNTTGDLRNRLLEVKSKYLRAHSAFIFPQLISIMSYGKLLRRDPTSVTIRAETQVIWCSHTKSLIYTAGTESIHINAAKFKFMLHKTISECEIIIKEELVFDDCKEVNGTSMKAFHTGLNKQVDCTLNRRALSCLKPNKVIELAKVQKVNGMKPFYKSNTNTIAFLDQFRN